MKTCSEIMTSNPVCCLPNDTVVSVAERMKIYDIGSLPVLENAQNQKIIGIVTDRDLALNVIGKSLDPGTTQVESVMTRKVVTCRADDELQVALDAMSDHQLRRIVIVDDGLRVLGIISQADVATRVDQPGKTAEVVKDISKESKA